MSHYYRLVDADPWVPESDDVLEAAAQEVFAHRSAENPEIPAGYTYLAQFLNHDLSLAIPKLRQGKTRVDKLMNARSARLDLQPLYGRGPGVDPQLYLPHRISTLPLGRNGAGELDLPRLADGGRPRAGRENEQWFPAVIGDYRNDQHVIVSQLHVAFVRLHNALAEAQVGVGAREALHHAQRETRFRYQWVVLHDLLPRLCPADILEEVREKKPGSGKPRFRKGLSVEFAWAAFRMGHTMVRDAYTLNDLERGKRPIPLFGSGAFEPRSLTGGRRLPIGWGVQWDHFVPFEGSRCQDAMRFDEHLARPLAWLPFEMTLQHRNLALRTLQGGWSVRLPSGRDVAKALGEKPIDFDGPLWLYFLNEARLQGSYQLGRSAARIVAETIYGIVQRDRSSYLNHRSGWRPPSREYGLPELLHESGARMTATEGPH